ncbi:MAG: hypothetical protein BGP09_10065 [Rhizobium sp. 60-20]|nr:MAG: hypothetical protein BGP09_10065 [Rhizobium sp. 60-20]
MAGNLEIAIVIQECHIPLSDTLKAWDACLPSKRVLKWQWLNMFLNVAQSIGGVGVYRMEPVRVLCC